MSDRQARAQGRPVTPIKREKFLWQAVRQGEARMTLDVFPGPGTAEALAFDAEEGNLVKRIDGAQTAVEFQTVDDSHRIAEPNVFRTQVAVPVHDLTVTEAIGDQDGSLGQKPPLRLVDPSHQSGRQGKTRVKQNTLVVGQAAIPAAEVGLARNQDRAGMPVEVRKRRHQAIELPGRKAARLQRVLKRLAVVETPHHHQPADDLARPAASRRARVEKSRYGNRSGFLSL